MMQYKDLTQEEKFEVYNKAFTFLHDHSDHVWSMVTKDKDSIAPSGSDMFHPELWKSIHWVWFLKEIRL